MTKIRTATVAGKFYTSIKEELLKTLDGFMVVFKAV